MSLKKCMIILVLLTFILVSAISACIYMNMGRKSYDASFVLKGGKNEHLC